MKRVYFFVTPKDASALLSGFERALPVKFVKSGILDPADLKVFVHSDQIPSLGISTAETGSQSDAYLVLHRDAVHHVERFVDVDGNNKLAIYNGSNEDSAVLTVAGRWGGDVLLAGNFSTMHDTATARKLVRVFASTISRGGFVKLSMWWAGPEALEMLKAGKRLATLAVQSPPEYDLPQPSAQILV
jgi:hypothetical protein